MKPVTYQYILNNINYLKQFKSNDTISVICNYCNNSKNTIKQRVQKKIYKKQKNFYCNIKCSSSHKICQTTKNCAECNKKVTRKPSQLKTNNIFCSKSCAAKCNNRLYPKRERRKCRKCLILLPRNTRQTLCDKCNPNIIDWTKITYAEMAGRRKYQKNSAIRNLARRNYMKSSEPKHCHICKYSLHFEVCHIKPIKDFNNNITVAEINDLSNLIALCKNHHWELDNKLISI